MENRTVVHGLLLAAFSVILYRLFVPVPYGSTAIAVAGLLAAVLAVFMHHREHAGKEQSLTVTVIATLAAGMINFLALYAAMMALLVVNQVGRNHLIAQILYEVTQRIQILTALSIGWFSFFYLIMGATVAVLVWYLRGYMPFHNRYLKSITVFLFAWGFSVSVFYLLFPAVSPVETVLQIAIDLVFVAFWGVLFESMVDHIRHRTRGEGKFIEITR